MMMTKASCTLVGLLITIISGAQGQGIPFGESPSFSSATLSTSISLGSDVDIQDFCFSVGITHTKLKDIAITLTFTSIQGFKTDYLIVNQPENQLDDLLASSPVIFTTYSFHTPAAEMGFADADPVTGFFYASSLGSLVASQPSNAGTWEVTVEDKDNDGESGVLVSFVPIFNDPAACGQTGAPSAAPSGSPSGPPVPSPTPPTPTCFSGTNTVQEQKKGVISMDSLSIGDYVKSSKGYSRVYGFLHLHRSVPADFLRILYRTANEESSWIEISAKHLLFSHRTPVAAGDVQVGDLLDGVNVASLVVTEIVNVKSNGVFAPATESGDILVSGVQASNYVDLLTRSALNQHTLSHAFVAFRRTFCRSLDFNNACREESYTEDGYATWIKAFLLVSSMLNQSGPTIQYLATLLVWPIVVVVTMFDQFLSGVHLPVLVIAAVIGLGCYRRSCRSLGKL